MTRLATAVHNLHWDAVAAHVNQSADQPALTHRKGRPRESEARAGT
jgi:hypothetical protein